MIDGKLLQLYKAELKEFEKDITLFEQGEHARFYFEILQGEVKMCSYNADGKEFIQGIFSAGRCFGEPPLFGDFTYPSHAITLTNCRIWQLTRQNFYQLIKDYTEVHFKITSAMASRLYYKAVMAQEISHEDPQHRILRLLNYLKREVYGISKPHAYEVELTRQQIADLTGLRVETAIRAIKKLEALGEIKIERRKIQV